MNLKDIKELTGIFTLVSVGILIPLSVLGYVPWWLSAPCAAACVFAHIKINKLNRRNIELSKQKSERRAKEFKATSWEADMLLNSGERVTRIISGVDTEAGVRELLRDGCERFGHTILSVRRPS